MIDRSLLLGIPFFEDLTPGALAILCARGTLVRFGPGETMWTAGGTPQGLHVVVTGVVHVVHSRAGRQQRIHTAERGATLGEVPLFGGGTYPATALAASRCTCVVLSKEAMHAAMAEDSRLSERLLAELSRRVRRLIDRLDGIVSLDVPTRLARYLLGRSHGVGAEVVTLEGTQAAVAEELGTVREVLVRALRALRRAGLIEGAGRGAFRILDREGLEAWAEGRRPHPAENES